jgi:hypothetical protein
MRKSINDKWANKRFGQLYIVTAWHERGITYAHCICDCGAKGTYRVADMKSGNTSSCGCFRKIVTKQRLTVHGMTNSRAYSIWTDMKKRCLNKNHRAFHRYGGRGITVCNRWKDSFEYFLSDMGHPPSDAHEIDRIDVNGNYQAANCRWTTRSENMRNTSRAVTAMYKGQRMHLKEIAALTGEPYLRLYYKVKTKGQDTIAD